MPATLQEAGKQALAIILKATPMHLAWGRGLPAWDTDPQPEPTEATALVDEIGRRLIASVQFVRPDAAGEITLPGGERYTLSVDPTAWLYLHVVFDFADAAGQTVREIGLFIGGSTQADLPPGQMYFTPDQVTQPGRLYMLDHSERLQRSGANYQAFDYVLPL